MKKISALLVLVCSTFFLPSANATVTYEIIDLSYLSPTSDRREGWAFDINDNGVIVGEWWLGISMYIDPVLGNVEVDVGETDRTTDTSIVGINNNNDLLVWNNGIYVDDVFSPWVTVDGDDGSVSSVLTGTPSPYFNSPPYDPPFTQIPDVDENGNLILRTYDGPADLLSLIGPDSGWARLNGLSMNIHGQIVGWGILSDPPSEWWNQYTPFLMNPLDQSVPEPASIVLLSLGLAGLGFSRRKKLISA